jgi:hypothetical protein
VPLPSDCERVRTCQRRSACIPGSDTALHPPRGATSTAARAAPHDDAGAIARDDFACVAQVKENAPELLWRALSGLRRAGSGG